MSNASGATGGGGGQAVDLATLSTQQLAQVKKQLDDELQHLTESFQSLRTAQSKFKDCIKSISDGLKTEDKPLLVPLTSSLYVPGTLASTSTVLVDVGTGFYVEKGIDDAKAFYEAKISDLGNSLKDLEKIVNQKSNNLRVVEDVLRQKVLQSGATQGQTSEQAVAA